MWWSCSGMVNAIGFLPPLGNHEYILEIFLQPYILPRFKVAQPCLNSALLYTNLACLSVFSVCLFVFLYPINVKTAEPIGPKFFVGHHVTTGKVYEWSKFQIVVSIKIRSSLNFWKFFVKIRELFLFCFTMYTKRTCLQLI